MNADWLITIIPLVNATGIPLLAIGIILLLRAYQKSVETYRDTSDHLRDENERIRKRLTEADTVYLSEVAKMRATVSDSVEAIKELQVRKISLLARADENTKEAVLSDVEKINEAIEGLREVGARAKNMDMQIRDVISSLNRDFQELTTHISELADQISDTKSRVTVVSVITSKKAHDELMSEIKKSKGLIAPPYEKQKTQRLTELLTNKLGDPKPRKSLSELFTEKLEAPKPEESPSDDIIPSIFDEE